MKEIKLLANLCLLELIEEETRGGIIVPENQRATNFGIVRGVGEGKKTRKGVTIPMEVKVGDRVMISPNGGRRDIIVDEKKCWLIDQDNLLAVMLEGEAECCQKP